MNPRTIGRALCAALLAAALAPAESLYEEDGVSLEGSVRLAARAAATCVAAPDADAGTQANAGQPLHVWRLDYGVYNGSGRALSNLTAHVRIESEWPPWSSWDGPEGSFPGPLEWAGGYKVLQRTGGLAAAGEARETVFVLAFHDRQPRFANWQLDYRFGEPSRRPEPELVQVEPKPPPGPPEPAPICKGREGESDCWREIPELEGCYVWNGGSNPRGAFHPDYKVTWSGGCENGLASGSGILTWMWEGSDKNQSHTIEGRGSLRDGKQHGHWVEHEKSSELLGTTAKGPYVDGKRHGYWVERFGNDEFTRTYEGPYANGEKHGRWVGRVDRADGRDYGWTTIWEHGRVLQESRR